MGVATNDHPLSSLRILKMGMRMVRLMRILVLKILRMGVIVVIITRIYVSLITAGVLVTPVPAAVVMLGVE